MAANNYRAPKQRELSESETLQTFEAWRQNLIFQLRSDPQFAPYFVAGAVWQRKTRAAPNRGYTDDAAGAANRRTAAQKAATLELMLDQIANFAPVLSRRSIVSDSTSLAYVWQALRLHYGFHSTGGNFIDFVNIELKPEERPETLYQRLRAFIDDNLLTNECGIMHHGAPADELDEVQPSLENLVVLIWLSKLHKDLPNLVKMKYGAELRSKTLASLKPEISQALDSLLLEVRENSPSVRIASSNNRRPPFNNNYNTTRFDKRQHPPPARARSKECSLCKAAGRSDYSTHFLSRCRYLSDAERRFMTRARSVTIEDLDEFDDFDDDSHPPPVPDQQSTANCGRVKVKRSPAFNVFLGHDTIKMTLDSGAETNMIKYDVAIRLNLPIIENSTQDAVQADGSSPLGVKGETYFECTRGNDIFKFEGLVVENLQADVLAGIPFQEDNAVYAHTPTRTIYFPTASPLTYGSVRTSSRTSSILRATVRQTVWPNEFVELSVGDNASDQYVAIESRADSNTSTSWSLSGIYPSVGNKIRVLNTSTEPKVVKKNDHVCQAISAFAPSDQPPDSVPPMKPTPSPPSQSHHSASVKVNPDNLLTPVCEREFKTSLREYDDVFNPVFTKYNQSLGPFKAVVNMGDVKPPQRKGRLPLYSRDRLVELQAEMDKLEALGVLAVPEDINVTAEYLNPSFLVKKPDNSWRLVTAFNEVGKYCKPQPSLMPNVDSTLRNIGQWKFLIKTDLTKAFFQIPLAEESMKYCGVVTPYKGVRVYTRCAMGMPGSETALEQLMCRIVGSLVEEGVVAKIADDLYCGGNSEAELLENWRRVLALLNEAGVKLSASKTVIAPRETTILGWIWQQGSIRASPHKIAPLSTCELPKTTKSLRSFLGAYKILARVIPNCSEFLKPLEKLTHGKKSSDKIAWSEESTTAFHTAQRNLSSNQNIVLPKEDDQLWIVTDGASSTHGLGATLYVQRDGKLHSAGFFSQQLKPTYAKWFTCEVEGLSIAAAVKNFEGFIIQSKHRTVILTDSKPCVDAYNLLLKGRFSSNARLSTFLSTVSRHHVQIQHLAGNLNLTADFASRNPASCDNPERCSICNFTIELESSVVQSVSTSEIIAGSASLPFTNRKSWLQIQSECADLRRTRAHLKQGTRPGVKETSIKCVKQYLNKVTLASDGLVVFKRIEPFAPPRECIVVPAEILHGLIMALHLRLSHPTINEMSKVFKRYFWAINMDKALSDCVSACHQCASLKKAAHALIPQASSDPPTAVAYQFAADVLKRRGQLIIIIREYVSAFTWTQIIQSEKHTDLRDAIIKLIIGVTPLGGPMSVLRTDAATGFQALTDDPSLKDARISIEIGNPKNINKNPVAEKAIQELEEELTREPQLHSLITDVALARVTARLNSRIRTDGLSAREIFLQRDQFTNNQIDFTDKSLIAAKHDRAVKNNTASAASKAHGRPPRPTQNISAGDLVYLFSERDKHLGRSRYLVISIEGEWCSIRKFANTTLSNSAYRVRISEVYKVVSTVLESSHKQQAADDDDPPPDPIIHPSNSVIASPPIPAVPVHDPIIPSQHIPEVSQNVEPVPRDTAPDNVIISQSVPPPATTAQQEQPETPPIPAEISSPIQPTSPPEPVPPAEMSTRSGRRVVKPSRFRSDDYIY